MSLGRWAVLDIETTGINPGLDQIIDIGFYQFDGLDLVRTYSSLVRYESNLSPFISKLTGITSEQVQKAPAWSKVEAELLSLEGHHLLAHNAQFERQFLERYFEKILTSAEREIYHDSIPFLALIFPQSSRLNLEYFLNWMNISEKEEHRGLADSRDLLKVMIGAVYSTFKNPELRIKLISLLDDFPDGYWPKYWLKLNQKELIYIAEQIDFDVQKMSFDGWQTNSVKSSKRLNSIIHFDGNSISSFLKDEASLSQKVSHYTYRPVQEDMANRIGKAFKNKVHALIQAPTGTGKTISYLLPASLFAKESSQPVLIATGTKALQEQAWSKDIPELRDMLDWDEENLKIVRLVGSSNHLCELLFREEDLARDFEWEKMFSRAYFEMFFYYNSQVNYIHKLNREHLPHILKKIFLDFYSIEESIKVDYRACVGHQCPFVNECSYQQGLKEAKDAHLILGNHALMFHWPRSLPRPANIIVDEAHKVENEATSAFAIEVNQKQLEIFQKQFSQAMGASLYLLAKEELKDEKLIEKIQSETQANLERIKDHLIGLQREIEALFKKQPNFQLMYDNEIALPQENNLKDTLSASLYHHLTSLQFIFQSLYELYTPLLKAYEDKSWQDDYSSMKAWVIVESQLSILEGLAHSFNHYISGTTEWSHSLIYNENDGYKFGSYPINVGKLIFEQVLTPSDSLVFTSATLANAKGDLGMSSIEWMTGYRYLPELKRFKSGFFYNALYDYEKQAKTFLISDTPTLNDPSFVNTLLDASVDIVNKLNGRSLFLFSSRKRFEIATDYLVKNFEGKIPVFIQGLGKNVIAEFKSHKSAILVGMESFGEGIDVPGDQIQFIVIDKIPDLRQDLVIQKRREFFEKSFGNEFADYFLSHRARSLHQKFGRLIRTPTDHGVIWVADSRVKRWKGATLKTFVRLMEPYDLKVVSLNIAHDEGLKYFDN